MPPPVGEEQHAFVLAREGRIAVSRSCWSTSTIRSPLNARAVVEIVGPAAAQAAAVAHRGARVAPREAEGHEAREREVEQPGS